MRRRRRRITPILPWLCSLALLTGPRTGQGQSAFRASLDAGAATVRQRDQSTVTAPTLATDLRLDGATTGARFVGGGVLAGARRWSAQGDASASWLPLSRGAFAWELGGVGSALRYSGAPSAGSAGLVTRQHLRIGDGGVWLGAGGGILSRPHWRAGVASAEGGGWRQHGALRGAVSLVAQRARLDTPIYVVDTAKVDPRAAAAPRSSPLTAVDLTTLAEWRTGRWELTGTATLRRAPRQRADLLGSAYGVAAYWIAPRTALLVSGGTLTADPLRALPARRVATLGVRWRPAGVAFAPVSRPSGRAAGPTIALATRDGRRTIRVRAPRATTVELRGDFTEWRAAPLTRAGDWWELDLAIAPGTRHVVLRIDGGRWLPPSNLPSVADDFGERVGLLVVP